MKKRGIGIAIVVFVILAFTVALFFVKEEWKETMGTFGPLNIMELDKGNDIPENRTSASFFLTERQDYYVEGSMKINKGSASCIITCNDVIIYEESFKTGMHEIETDVFQNKKGEIQIEVKASDDVDGTYDINLHTRESVLNHMISRIKDYL